ncbi:MAG: hypothetical protein AB1540_13660 [Bdellovibrionota bacterium]
MTRAYSDHQNAGRVPSQQRRVIARVIRFVPTNFVFFLYLAASIALLLMTTKSYGGPHEECNQLCATCSRGAYPFGAAVGAVGGNSVSVCRCSNPDANPDGGIPFACWEKTPFFNASTPTNQKCKSFAMTDCDAIPKTPEELSASVSRQALKNENEQASRELEAQRQRDEFNQQANLKKQTAARAERDLKALDEGYQKQRKTDSEKLESYKETYGRLMRKEGEWKDSNCENSQSPSDCYARVEKHIAALEDKIENEKKVYEDKKTKLQGEHRGAVASATSLEKEGERRASRVLDGKPLDVADAQADGSVNTAIESSAPGGVKRTAADHRASAQRLMETADTLEQDGKTEEAQGLRAHAAAHYQAAAQGGGQPAPEGYREYPAGVAAPGERAPQGAGAQGLGEQAYDPNHVPVERFRADAPKGADKNSSEKKGPPTFIADGGRCSASIAAMMAAEAKKAGFEGSHRDLARWFNDSQNPEAQRIKNDHANYNCESDEDFLEGYKISSQLIGITSAATAGAAAQTAQLKVLDVSSSSDPNQQGNVHKTALEAMGTAHRAASITSGVAALAHGWTAYHTARIGGRQERASERTQDALMTEDVAQDNRVGSEENYSAAGAGFAMAQRRDLSSTTANERGHTAATAAMAEHKRLGSQGDSQMWQNIIQATVAGASFVGNWMQADAYNKAAGEFTNPQPSTQPLGAPPQDTGFGGLGTTPPQFSPSEITANPEVVPLGDSPNENLGGGPPLIPPPLAGNPTGGGLKEPGPGLSNGFIAPGQTQGNAAGGGAGLAGGGAAGGADKERGEGGSESIAGGPSKFEGGGAGGFGIAGGGARHGGDTGSLDFAGLLGALTKGDEKERAPAGGILDYNTGRRNALGGSGRDDGSILGRNSNLFVRISNQTMDHYKRGQLR